jgi:hypothetical protein
MTTSFEIFTTVKIQVEVFWVMTPCSDTVRISTFWMTMLPPSSAETLISYHNTKTGHNPEDLNLKTQVVKNLYDGTQALYFQHLYYLFIYLFIAITTLSLD